MEEPQGFIARRSPTAPSSNATAKAGSRHTSQSGEDVAGDAAGSDQWGLGMPSCGVGWQPSRFLVDRAEAERAFALAERLGGINAAELGTTWPSMRKPSPATAWALPARNPWPSGSAAEAARQRTGRPAPPPWTRCSVALNPIPFPPGSGRRPSSMSGSAATRSTASSARVWWSSCTARAGPPDNQPCLGDHPAGRPRSPAGADRGSRAGRSDLTADQALGRSGRLLPTSTDNLHPSTHC
jgi:hypothetical protein